MQGERQQLFACAALSPHQHRRLTSRDLSHRVEHRQHRRAASLDAVPPERSLVARRGCGRGRRRPRGDLSLQQGDQSLLFGEARGLEPQFFIQPGHHLPNLRPAQRQLQHLAQRGQQHQVIIVEPGPVPLGAQHECPGEFPVVLQGVHNLDFQFPQDPQTGGGLFPRVVGGRTCRGLGFEQFQQFRIAREPQRGPFELFGGDQGERPRVGFAQVQGGAVHSQQFATTGQQSAGDLFGILPAPRRLNEWLHRPVELESLANHAEIDPAGQAIADQVEQQQQRDHQHQHHRGLQWKPRLLIQPQSADRQFTQQHGDRQPGPQGEVPTPTLHDFVDQGQLVPQDADGIGGHKQQAGGEHGNGRRTEGESLGVKPGQVERVSDGNGGQQGGPENPGDLPLLERIPRGAEAVDQGQQGQAEAGRRQAQAPVNAGDEPAQPDAEWLRVATEQVVGVDPENAGDQGGGRGDGEGVDGQRGEPGAFVQPWLGLGEQAEEVEGHDGNQHR